MLSFLGCCFTPKKILLVEHEGRPEKSSDIDPELFANYLQRVIELRKKEKWSEEELMEYRKMRVYLSGGDNYL